MKVGQLYLFVIYSKFKIYSREGLCHSCFHISGLFRTFLGFQILPQTHSLLFCVHRQAGAAERGSTLPVPGDQRRGPGAAQDLRYRNYRARSVSLSLFPSSLCVFLWDKDRKQHRICDTEIIELGQCLLLSLSDHFLSLCISLGQGQKAAQDLRYRDHRARAVPTFVSF
jgi:hypothetical protein